MRRVLRGLAPALLALALPRAGAAGERIREFRADVRLASDARFEVEERILYDFGDAQRHGIYREIPVRYGRGRAADYRIALDLLSVTDGHGETLPYRTSREGAYLRIRIGDPDRSVSGEHEYRIRYRVRRGILWFEDHDELYWNVTGSEWKVPIERAEVTVLTPPDRPAPEPRALCFTGRRGSVETACSLSHAERMTYGESDRPFAAGEGLTLVLSLPKGLIDQPSRLSRWLDRASDYLGLASLLPVAVFAGMGALWWRTGRDPGGPQAVPVRYEPPEDMTPAEMGTLLDERVDLSDITATVLDLAVRGYLRIEETEARGFLFLGREDFVLTRLRPPDGSLTSHEQYLMGALFGNGSSVRVSELRNRFYQKLPGIRSALYERVSSERGWFQTSPERVRRRWAGLALGLGLPAALLAFVLERPSLALGLAASAGIGALWSRVLPRATLAGRRAKQQIRGFQEFVLRVEADRLERLGRRNLAEFERLLPFAFVLGAADAWADAFADLYREPPSWYVGHGDGAFQPRSFVGRLGHSLDTLGTALSSQPRGSGSSGFSSGGGFSGGGFGGGGGGSW